MIHIKEEFMDILEVIKIGTSHLVENADCIIFSEGNIYSYNDSIFCHCEYPSDITGVLDFKSLYSVIKAMPKGELLITDSVKHIEIKYGKNFKNRAKVKKKQIAIDELPRIDNSMKWKRVIPGFKDAAVSCCDVAAKGYAMPIAACVCISKYKMQAMDNFQALEIRFQDRVISADYDILVNANVLRSLVGQELSKIAVTDNWLHFKSKNIIISGRRVEDDYIDISGLFISDEGTNLVLPSGIVDCLLRAKTFNASNGAIGKQALVFLEKNHLLLTCESELGTLEEEFDMEYDGPNLSFKVSPTHLQSLAKGNLSLLLLDNKIILNGDNSSHVITLEVQ